MSEEQGGEQQHEGSTRMRRDLLAYYQRVESMLDKPNFDSQQGTCMSKSVSKNATAAH